jgi:hypothetical protein
MNIQLRFPDNSKLVVPFNPRQKIQILITPIFYKYPNYKNSNAISFNYSTINDKTKKMHNIVLDKTKTFQKYKINKNTIIHVKIDMNSIFFDDKKPAVVDTLVSDVNHNINTQNTNTNATIITKLKEFGFTDMDDETINALIDTCKAKNGSNQVSVEDILVFLT